MRKIVLSTWITLDGCIAGPDDKMDWLRGDAQMMEYEQSFVDAADTLLLGRKTLQRFFGLLASTRSRSGAGRPSPPDVQRSPMGKTYIKKPIVMTESNIVLKGNLDGPGLGIEFDDNIIDNECGIPEWKFPELWDGADGFARDH